MKASSCAVHPLLVQPAALVLPARKTILHGSKNRLLALWRCARASGNSIDRCGDHFGGSRYVGFTASKMDAMDEHCDRRTARGKPICALAFRCLLDDAREDCS